jgi:hypothetical protein
MQLPSMLTVINNKYKALLFLLLIIKGMGCGN